MTKRDTVQIVLTVRENLAVAYASAGMCADAAATFEDLLSIFCPVEARAARCGAAAAGSRRLCLTK